MPCLGWYPTCSNLLWVYDNGLLHNLYAEKRTVLHGSVSNNAMRQSAGCEPCSWYIQHDQRHIFTSHSDPGCMESEAGKEEKAGGLDHFRDGLFVGESGVE